MKPSDFLSSLSTYSDVMNYKNKIERRREHLNPLKYDINPSTSNCGKITLQFTQLILSWLFFHSNDTNSRCTSCFNSPTTFSSPALQSTYSRGPLSPELSPCAVCRLTAHCFSPPLLSQDAILISNSEKITSPSDLLKRLLGKIASAQLSCQLDV